MSAGLYPNTKKQQPYKNPIEPSDFLQKPIYNDWKGFSKPQLSSEPKHTGRTYYGQDYIGDNPIAQLKPGVLFSPPIPVPQVGIPRAYDPSAIVAASSGLPQSGSGAVNYLKPTWAQPPSHSIGFDFLPRVRPDF